MSKELGEKFVSDDGVSSVEAPVVGAGGPIVHKRADVKKSVDPKAGKVASVTPGQGAVKEEAEADSEVVIEEVEIAESIAAIFEGMDLSEEFTSKVKLVFEAAVNEAATAKANQIIAEQTEALEAEMKESVDSAVEKIVENLDSYLDYVVEEWMKENELAIETGIKVEMAESLMDGLKTLFEEHNIDVTDETIDVVAGLEEEVEALKNTANEAINENVELQKQVASLKAGKVFDEMTEDLTITQRERLKVLSEKLGTNDIEEYKSDLTTLKESFFNTPKKVIAEDVSDVEQEIITEEAAIKKPVSDYSSINALVESLNSRQKSAKQ
jgi:hypothetical protein